MEAPTLRLGRHLDITKRAGSERRHSGCLLRLQRTPSTAESRTCCPQVRCRVRKAVPCRACETMLSQCNQNRLHPTMIFRVMSMAVYSYENTVLRRPHGANIISSLFS